MRFKYTGEFTTLVYLLAAQCFRDEYTGPWSGNRDIEVSGGDGLTTCGFTNYKIVMDCCRDKNCGH
jgi:hypothetical protein